MSDLYYYNPEWQRFVQTIRENPDDDTTRLVAADWLDEKGTEEAEQRANLIRTSIELHRRPPPPIKVQTDYLLLEPKGEDKFDDPFQTQMWKKLWNDYRKRINTKTTKASIRVKSCQNIEPHKFIHYTYIDPSNRSQRIIGWMIVEDYKYYGPNDYIVTGYLTGENPDKFEEGNRIVLQQREEQLIIYNDDIHPFSKSNPTETGLVLPFEERRTIISWDRGFPNVLEFKPGGDYWTSHGKWFSKMEPFVEVVLPNIPNCISAKVNAPGTKHEKKVWHISKEIPNKNKRAKGMKAFCVDEYDDIQELFDKVWAQDLMFSLKFPFVTNHDLDGGSRFEVTYLSMSDPSAKLEQAEGNYNSLPLLGFGMRTITYIHYSVETNNSSTGEYYVVKVLFERSDDFDNFPGGTLPTNSFNPHVLFPEICAGRYRWDFGQRGSNSVGMMNRAMHRLRVDQQARNPSIGNNILPLE
jgi:uncharacterized protein (TIGR02996 family)